MCGAFARRELAIVTCRAGGGRCSMVKADLRPGGRDVAVFADINCRDVVLCLAGGGAAIMAADAGARDAGMVKANL